LITVPNHVTQHRNPAIDPYGTRFNGSVRLASAAQPVAADVLIKARSGFHDTAKVLRYASKRKRRTIRPGATLTYN
jgi:nicotinic acid mononucleotide adenylyltransferase